MRVLITGAQGQFGRELVRRAPAAAMVRALDRNALDLTDTARLQELVAEFRPTHIINAAGYTAVNRAESERDEAYTEVSDPSGSSHRAAGRPDAVVEC